jgi:hypothetical protein
MVQYLSCLHFTAAMQSAVQQMVTYRVMHMMQQAMCAVRCVWLKCTLCAAIWCLQQLSLLLLVAPLHPQAARLLCSFREYHRRAQLGLATFYANKLAALEDGLLKARETLFAAQEQQPEEQEKLVSQEQVGFRAVILTFALRGARLMIWWRGGQLCTQERQHMAMILQLVAVRALAPTWRFVVCACAGCCCVCSSGCC